MLVNMKKDKAIRKKNSSATGSMAKLPSPFLSGRSLVNYPCFAMSYSLSLR